MILMMLLIPLISSLRYAADDMTMRVCAGPALG